ncbi:o-succinylbenzoate synthase [Demequina muriae]|uniref:o-succinylbenzoate synthase n=1 Tax=Demequina muriae TaxID=3051664 RepID=A0ABT8GD90_9MICO|nr:o-succinylbenzoate synthase [Demequina sp. EGI L300058]MDN4479398.1 o-succinylbenzoate synthase [Demequina sp. EGI L300058]
MQIDHVTLRTLRIPLVTPFTTSFSTQTARTVLTVEVSARVAGREVTGWGECGALAEPVYSDEYAAGAADVIERFLLPRLAAASADTVLTAETVGELLEPVVGHRMAKAALEAAILDAQLKAAGTSFATYLGVTRDRVPSGVSVGIQDSIRALLDAVAGYLDEGYQRIKLKIQPGWDVEPVRAVREAHPDVALQVDANAAYTLVDAAHLRRLDEFDLLLIEQPLAEDDLRQHAELARAMATPMCLDESVVSAASAADAIQLGAAAVINIKPSRVGGYLEARRIHDVARASGIAVWCGGMLETGLARGANAALAGLPGFTLPGDISASSRFYARDLTTPYVIENGSIAVPTFPGLCEQPEADALAEFSTEVREVSPA